MNRAHVEPAGSSDGISPAKADYIAKIGVDGKVHARINPYEWLPDFSFFEWMTDDGNGIWITGANSNATEPLEATVATTTCASIKRTGPDGGGNGILIHIDARTNCPDRLLDFTDPARGDQEVWTDTSGHWVGGTEAVPTGLAFTDRWLFVNCFGYNYGVDPNTGKLDRLEGADGDLLGVAFGGVWINHPLSSSGSDRPTGFEVIRVDLPTGRVVSRFTPGAAEFSHPPTINTVAAFSDHTMWWLAETGTGSSAQVKLVRYESGTDTARVINPAIDLEYVGSMMYANGRLYLGRSHTPSARGLAQLLVVDATTGQKIRDVSTHAESGFRHLGILDGILFAAADGPQTKDDPDDFGSGLWWMNIVE